MALERYARQIAFQGIGREGQEKLRRSRVAIVGLGATGTVIANNLCRAGVGFLRLIDRDRVEMTNLQRQALCDEEDVSNRAPKAMAAAAHLSRVNGEVELEPLVCDVDADNAGRLMMDVDLVLDGTDNFETRLLINEACHKHGVPWIYNGVIMSYGTSMNILQGENGPCFRCLYSGASAPDSQASCASVGVLNMITGIIGSVASAEALKILTGSPEVRRTLFLIDVWMNVARYEQIGKDPACPVCGGGRYAILDGHGHR